MIEPWFGSFNAALNRVDITGIASDFDQFGIRYRVQCATFYQNKHYVVLSEPFSDHVPFPYKLTVSLLDEATEHFQNLVDIGIFIPTDFGQAACGSGRYQTGTVDPHSFLKRAH